MNKWSSEGLPQDVFDRILNPCSFLDIIRMGFVCKSWHKVSKLNIRRRPQLPWLMMPSNPNCKSEEEGEEERLCIVSLSNNTSYYDIKIPQIRGENCCGSFSNSGGWLMTIRYLEVQLFHPWCRIRLNLPRFFISSVSDIDFDSDHTIIKAAMSDDAKVVTVINSSRNFAFCRIGKDMYMDMDMIWTLIPVTRQVYRDIIYYKGQFYAVGWDGAIGVLNINTTNPYIETLMGGVTFLSRTTGLQSEMYFVRDLATESLFMVRRLAQVDFDGRASYIYTTYDFQVYELELHEGEVRCVEVESLGDRVMFVGLVSSMLVIASQFSGFEGNCIYFTHDWEPNLYENKLDMGIFNMEDRTIHPLFPNFPNRSHPSVSPPIWITPPPLVQTRFHQRVYN